MFRFYACILAMWLCFQSASFAQSPTIALNSYDFAWTTCLNATYRLGVTTSGAFNADNKFSVQVRKTENSAVIAELPAALVNGKLEFVLKDSLTFGNTQVQFRGVASSPKVQTDWSSYGVQVYTKGKVTLNPFNKVDTLNAFDRAIVGLSAFSAGEIRITLNDSTRYSFYGSTQNPVVSSEQPLLLSDKIPVYTIAHAENNCGAMQVSGQYKPVINQTSIKAVNIAPNAFCENSDVKVSLSTSGTAFTSQTRYRLRFTEVTNSGNPGLKAEVAATLEDGILAATFPDKFKLQNSRLFSVQIITDNPATVSSPSDILVNVWPKTTASFATPSQTLSYFGQTSIMVNVTGLPPFSVELTNGAKATSSYNGVDFYVFPMADQTYSIKSVTSSCGTFNIENSETLRLKVPLGIRIEETSNGQTTCAGPKTRIKFLTSATLTSATTFAVRVQNSNGGEVTAYNATRNGDYVEFNMPAKAGGYQGYSYQIVTTSPSMVSQQSYYVNVQTPPNITYSTNTGSFNFNIPTNVQLGYQFEGGGPYTVEEMDGKVKTYDYSEWNAAKFFVKETSEYRIKSISNACFKNENPRVARLTVNSSSEPGIYLEPFKKGICDNDSLEITFGTVGQFDPGNKFSIQINTSCCNYQSLRVVEKDGKYKIKVSLQSVSYSEPEIRVASSNPVLFSSTERVSIHTATPQFYVSPANTEAEPYRYVPTGPTTMLYLSSNYSTITGVVYTENGVEKTFAVESNNTSIPVTPTVGKVNTYVVKTATNACGTFPVDKTSYIQPIPYRIQLALYNTTYYCAGSPFSLNFAIVEGQATDATFSLQMGVYGSNEYQTVVSGVREKFFNTTIPKDFKSGGYSVRVVSSDGSVSDVYPIQIGAAPTATLTTDSSQPNPVKIEAGQTLVLKVLTTGNGPISTIFSDNTRQDFYGAEQSWYVTPTKSQQYSIRSVSNSCGYGTTSGKVDVSVNPRLTANTSQYSVCDGGSITVSYELMGDTDLSDGYIRFALTNQSDNSTIRLDSTKSVKGSITLKMPDNLPGSYYAIVCSVAKYNLSTTLGVSVTTKPSVTLSGSTTINSGESTQLVIRSNKYNPDVPKFLLSDGTSGNIYANVGSTNYITVSPTKTTTYTVTSITNGCGNGIATGSATVEVNPPSERSVSVTSLASKTGYSMCTGDTVLVDYKTAGSFTAGNVFTVQLSDSTGKNFRVIPSIAGTKPIQAILPTDLVANAQYRIRVTASDPNTAAGAYGLPVMAMQKARAKFASESVIFDGVHNPKVTVLLEGGGPWYYQFGTDLSVINRQSYTATDVVELMQASPSQYYRLFRVSNGCGAGIIDSPSMVKVEVITAVEPNGATFQVVVAPNPVQDILTVKSANDDEKTIRLIGLNGAAVRTLKTRRREETLDIRNLSSGIYILHIDAKGKKATFKVIKQ